MDHFVLPTHPDAPRAGGRWHSGIVKPRSSPPPPPSSPLVSPQTMYLDSSSFITTLPFSSELCDRAAEILHHLLPTSRSQLKIWGKLIEVPRFDQAYGRDYRFSGSTHPALPSPPIIEEIIAHANHVFGTAFNSAFVNWYPDGHSYISPHSDDESQLVPGSPVLTLSLGQERLFRIRWKHDHVIAHDAILKHGEILLMGGEMQKKFTHEIVKVNGKKGKALGERISVTLRVFA